jgi:hypothetical protein
VVKKERLEKDISPDSGNKRNNDFSDANDDVQEMPEDLSSSGNANSYRCVPFK